jgi:hypothetical protein
MAIGITPQLTKTALGTFGVQWDGLVQGTAMPSPNAVFNLAGGWVASTETDPMYGGIAITEGIPTAPGSPPATPAMELGGPLTRASGYPNLTGFTVFDQDYAAINSPQSEVQLADVYMQMNFYRLGSGQRIVVACDPALISLYGQPITQQVSWDFSGQRLVAFSTTALACKVLKMMPAGCMTVTYTSGTKTAAWNRNGAAAVILI